MLTPYSWFWVSGLFVLSSQGIHPTKYKLSNIFKNFLFTAGIKNLAFRDVLQTVEAEVRKFEAQGINKIIAMGHAGYSRDKEIAAIKGIDIVVGGHSHTLLYSGKFTTAKESGNLGALLLTWIN